MRRTIGGTGLVELAVAVVIGLVLLAVVFSITGYSVRTIDGVERNLEALHAAQMNLERIEADLHHALLRSREDLSLFAGAALGQARDRVAWTIAEPGPGGREPVYVGLPVEYRAVPAGTGLFRLARNGANLGPTLFRRLEFRLESGPAFAAGRSNYFVRTTVTGVDAGAKKDFMLEALTGVDPLCAWSGGQAWNPNPDAQAPVLAFAAP